MNNEALKYISSYPETIKNQVNKLFIDKKASTYLTNKYPVIHQFSNDKLLRNFVFELKTKYIKKSTPLKSAIYDDKIHIIENALGTHSYVSKQHGTKIKKENSIKISTLFKHTPLAFLNMICVHELAHLKEKEHNKNFYKLCCHMMPDYHQVELDVRIFLIAKELNLDIYT